ncbi:hypothetical protein [Actinomadura nitritigenes]
MHGLVNSGTGSSVMCATGMVHLSGYWREEWPSPPARFPALLL